MLPGIDIKVIPHTKQRYDTCGDYYRTRDGVVHFRVSEMKNPIYEFCVLIHELTEWFLCRLAGVRMVDIDAFDMKFERDRAKGLHSKSEEPGDHRSAPYRKFHQFATKIERQIIRRCGVAWWAYDRRITEL